jgi:hypothetical protein
VTRFGDCFILIFAQLAVGGAVAMAVPPFRTLERGFFKSSAGIFLGFALVFLAAKVSLVVRGGSFGLRIGLELALWAAFCATFGTYLASLWGDHYVRRARAFTLSLALGLAAIVLTVDAYRPVPLPSVLGFLYTLPVLTGTLSMGGVAAGMLLGHWYLIDLGLSIDPLQRLLRFFLWATALNLAVLLVLPAVYAVTSPYGAEAVRSLWTDHRPLLLTRLGLGPVAALLIGYLVHRTLQIPQTMAATGLFYIAILFVMVGEMLSRLILFRTALAL